eukprot:scaffold325445_cov113-Tisochrysis_lutea.AAC.1
MPSAGASPTRPRHHTELPSTMRATRAPPKPRPCGLSSKIARSETPRDSQATPPVSSPVLHCHLSPCAHRRLDLRADPAHAARPSRNSYRSVSGGRPRSPLAACRRSASANRAPRHGAPLPRASQASFGPIVAPPPSCCPMLEPHSACRRRGQPASGSRTTRRACRSRRMSLPHAEERASRR